MTGKIEPQLDIERHPSSIPVYPLHLPWASKQIISLGSGFNSTGSGLVDTPFSDDAAFRFSPYDNNGAFRSTTTKHGSSSFDHMSFAGTASAERFGVGLSVKGSFDRDVSRNTDSNKASIQHTLRIGTIQCANPPIFAPRARKLLFANSIAEFHSLYGDCYVAQLTLGAENTTLLSTSSGRDISSEIKSVQAKAYAWGFSEAVYSGTDKTTSDSKCFDLTFSGLDTLSGLNATWSGRTRKEYEENMEAAVRHMADGLRLEERFRELVGNISLDGSVSKADTEKCGTRGLVLELVLLPYTGLREYKALTATPNMPETFELGGVYH